MDLNPEKFFIGLMDFFSIILPGALLTFLLMIVVESGVLGDQYFNLAGPQGWAAFLFVSYLLGHLVFLIGSLFLDWFYDWARHYTLNWQIKEVVRRETVLPRIARALIWLADERDLAVERTGRIKEQALSRLRAKKAINTFQWSKAVLSAESPASLSMVQRFEADSKFFRSFVVVLAPVFIGLLFGVRLFAEPMAARRCSCGADTAHPRAVALLRPAPEVHEPSLLVCNHPDRQGR
jgi:hypothetical protein